MNKAYEVTQGLLSWVGLVTLGVAFPFTLEALGVLDVIGYSTYVAETALIFGSVGLMAVAIKLAMGWFSNKFWVKIQIANKLHALAGKIDPRRN